MYRKKCGAPGEPGHFHVWDRTLTTAAKEPASQQSPFDAANHIKEESARATDAADIRCDGPTDLEFPVTQPLAQIVLTTCPADAAERLARGLVDARLAACVNIVPAVRSIYRWRGAIETADEVLLVIKGSSAHFSAIEAHVRATHPYELPELIAVPVVAGLAAYVSWLNHPE